ncbi:MAG: LysR family transcriptional regulator [Desulfofustis sp.]
MDIHHLKTFIAITENGTFGAAGEVVGLTQSAVSQQIKTMEEQLGVKLFDRKVRPPALTVQGLTLLEGARRIVREYEVTARAARGEKLSGNLVLGAIRTSFIALLPKALSSLRERYPQLRINAHTLDSYDMVPMVTAGRLDAAIIPSNIQLNDNISWLPFAVEPLVVISNKDIKGKPDKYILENSPFIKFSRKVPSADLVNEELRKRNINVHVEMNIDSYAAIVQLVSHGLGVSVVPEQVRGEDFPPNIRKVPFGIPPIKRLLGIIHQKESSKSNIISVLYNELCELCGFSSNDLL